MMTWLDMHKERFGPDEILSYFGIKAPPVDIFAILDALRVTVELCTLEEGQDGMVHGFDDGYAFLKIEKGHAPVRQRFTAAHDLGHLIIDGPGPALRDVRSSYGTDRREIRANRFAAQILMPSWMVRPRLSEVPRRSRPELMAVMFEVSTAAAKNRLKTLAMS